ncbi:MAG: D-2-hydroxyacid dehydrogenase [Solirubrobacterales bacterium]|nr:D-2-hydroxyacid dehydrogenase [Solirubrobacterales bacterium]
MKIVVLDAHPLTEHASAWAPLNAAGEVQVYDHSSAEQVQARARDAAVLITMRTPVTARVIEQAPALRLIAVSFTGYDCVDVEAAHRRGIVVVNVPTYGTDSVAQLTLALLLELCHHVGLHDRAVHAGEWARSGPFSFWKTPLTELAGKVLGVVGFGHIGRRVAELGHALGMAVLAEDRERSEPPAYRPFAWAELDEVFAQADVVTLHCPLTPQTTGLVNRRRLERVKPGALLLNTARGGLVVEADLADALNEGRLAGAAVDVASQEPIRPDSPLLTARNCVITPHIAWATREARERLLATTIANVVNFLRGRPTNVVP